MRGKKYLFAQIRYTGLLVYLLQLLGALLLPLENIEARSSSVINQRSVANLLSGRSNRPMAAAARQHVPAIHLSDALLVPCHWLVTGAIRAQNAFGRKVTGFLPKPMLNAVTRSQVRHENLPSALVGAACVTCAMLRFYIIRTAKCRLQAGHRPLSITEVALVSGHSALTLTSMFNSALLEVAKEMVIPQLAVQAAKEVGAAAFIHIYLRHHSDQIRVHPVICLQAAKSCLVEEHYSSQQASLTAALAVIADSAAFISQESTKLQVNLLNLVYCLHVK